MRNSGKGAGQMFQAVLGGIIFIILGLVYCIKPVWIWRITERWKSYYADEPSDFYLLVTRIVGGFFVLFGVVMIILMFVLK